MKIHFLSKSAFPALLFLYAAALSSCTTSPYYQKQNAVPGGKWDYSFQPVYRINIPDSNHQYATYLVIRHDEAYPFANIWVRMKVKAPGDSTFSQGVRIERQLADPEGKWQSNAMAAGGMWEHMIRIGPKDAPRFKKPGTYEIKLEQVMRANPLPSVMNVGIRVEKLK